MNLKKWLKTLINFKKVMEALEVEQMLEWILILLVTLLEVEIVVIILLIEELVLISQEQILIRSIHRHRQEFLGKLVIFNLVMRGKEVLLVILKIDRGLVLDQKLNMCLYIWEIKQMQLSYNHQELVLVLGQLQESVRLLYHDMEVLAISIGRHLIQDLHLIRQDPLAQGYLIFQDRIIRLNLLLKEEQVKMLQEKFHRLFKVIDLA